MTTVRVRPSVVDVCDILEYALALLEEHGWRQGRRIPEGGNWPEVAKHGLSLHDSIGMACYMLSGETGKAAGIPAGYSKNFPTGPSASGHGYHGTMREKATNVVQKALPQGETDITYNDNAANANAILSVLDAAIKEACNAK